MNAIPKNLFLKNKNNNYNNNNISISINNNVIQLRYSPDIVTENNIEKAKAIIKNKILSQDIKILKESSSSKIIRGEKDTQNILRNSEEICKKKKIISEVEKKECKMKGKSVQKNSSNRLNEEKEIKQNLENNNNNFPLSQKWRKIRKMKKIINVRHKVENLNNGEIYSYENIIKGEGKKLIRKGINKNEIINIGNKEKKDKKIIHSQKKLNIMTSSNFLKIDENNQDSSQVNKIYKVKIKKISANQLNKNFKIIKSCKTSNPNVFIITNLSKNSISNNERNNVIYSPLATDTKKDKNNNYLNITNDNNTILNNLPNSTKNRKVIKKDIIIKKEAEENIITNNILYKAKNNKINNTINMEQNNNINNENNKIEIKKEKSIHRKNNFSFHINNIIEIKNINFLKKDINFTKNKNQLYNEINPDLVKNINKKLIKKNNKNNNNKKIINNPKINESNSINNNNSNINSKDISGLNNTSIQKEKILNIDKSENEKTNIDNVIKTNDNNINNENKEKNIQINNNDIEIKNLNYNYTYNLNELTIYFYYMEQEISSNKKRRLSFDIRHSSKHFSLLAINTDNFELILLIVIIIQSYTK